MGVPVDATRVAPHCGPIDLLVSRDITLNGSRLVPMGERRELEVAEINDTLQELHHTSALQGGPVRSNARIEFEGVECRSIGHIREPTTQEESAGHALVLHVADFFD